MRFCRQHNARFWSRTSNWTSATEFNGVARFRGNVILQRKGLDANFRIIPLKIPTLDELGLPPVVKKFCDFHQGLILVTGATGQGKSTTLASMIDLINSARPVHILTIEDPIEFKHPIKKGIVNQRQVGMHTQSFSNALRAALREDPDVIMVGELRDLESVRLAVTASETGHLVMGTLATSSGPKTVDRMIDSFPPDEQNQIRTLLAEGLRAVITQKLVPTSDGKGQALATEILVATVPVANLIRAEKTYQLPSVMQTGRRSGDAGHGRFNNAAHANGPYYRSDRARLRGKQETIQLIRKYGDFLWLELIPCLRKW